MGLKRILSVCHCILNTAAKVEHDGADRTAESALRRDLLSRVWQADIQLLQLPCPEFCLYGSQRWGHVKDQFLHPHFRESVRELLRPFLLQMEEYAAHPDQFELLGIVSIEGSPSCGYHLTCRAPWRGEIGRQPERIQALINSLEMTQEAGVFMQILQTELTERDLKIPIYTLEEAICLLQSRSAEDRPIA